PNPVRIQRDLSQWFAAARSVRRVYFKGGHLACRRCCNAIYASQVCGKHSRLILQAIRLKTFLELKAGTGMSRRNQQRLKARITTAVKQELNSKRLAHHSIPMPSSNHCTRGLMHWR